MPGKLPLTITALQAIWFLRYFLVFPSVVCVCQRPVCVLFVLVSFVPVELSDTDMANYIDSESEELRRETERLRKENAELRRHLGLSVREPSRGYQEKSDQLPLKIEPTSPLTADSTAADKIALFRSLFRGREDVYANFWTNERSGKKGYSPAVE